MRFATFNILNGRVPTDQHVTLDGLTESVKRLDADVLALQEVDHNQHRSENADLTAIAANHGGIFPKDDVRRFITGEKVTGSHGTRQMPVWGPIFSQIEIDTDYGKVRLENLVNYIQSMQGKR